MDSGGIEKSSLTSSLLCAQGENQVVYLPIYVVCYLNRTPECSRLNAAILRLTRVLSDKNVFTCAA